MTDGQAIMLFLIMLMVAEMILIKIINIISQNKELNMKNKMYKKIIRQQQESIKKLTFQKQIKKECSWTNNYTKHKLSRV